jgi:hypothetical protein
MHQALLGSHLTRPEGVFMGNFRQFKEWRNGKSLDLRSAGKLTDTPSGLKAGSATTNYLKSAMFTDPRIEPDVSCSPIEVYLCDDFNQATYCHLVCSLTQAAEIVKFHSLFAASLVAAVQILQKCWVEMCEDIRSGTPNAKILNPELRRAMEKILKPDPQLAAMIERECSKNDWAGIIPRIWPNTVVITTILSGSMQHYVPILKHFAGNNIALVSLFYGSCECHLLGLNVRLNCPTDQVEYMIWPESAYFEFIPVAADDSHADNIAPHSTGKKTPQLVDTADVELGKEYEIVITTVSGRFWETLNPKTLKSLGLPLSLHMLKYPSTGAFLFRTQLLHKSGIQYDPSCCCCC